MDPITLILTALVTGAAKAAGDAVPDAYKALKALIQKKFVGKPEAEMALAKHEEKPEKPEVWKEPLKDALVEAGVDKDEAVIKEAQELMKALDPQGTGTGAYTVTVAGNVYGVAGTNTGIVDQTFN